MDLDLSGGFLRRSAWLGALAAGFSESSMKAIDSANVTGHQKGFS